MRRDRGAGTGGGAGLGGSEACSEGVEGAGAGWGGLGTCGEGWDGADAGLGWSAGCDVQGVCVCRGGRGECLGVKVGS